MRWSISSHNTFRRCQRQYFFGNSMSSHNAKDPERREAFILKQLQSLPLWQGSLVHKGIHRYMVPYLTNGYLPNEKNVIRETLAMASKQIAFSSARQYRIEGQTKGGAGDSYCALFEHEYEIEISSERIREVYDTVSQSLSNLFKHDDFLNKLKDYSGHKSEFLAYFYVAGSRVLAQLDLLCFNGRLKPVIVDWKVGQSDSSDYTRQVMTYSLCLLRSPLYPGVEVNNVSAYEFNLLKDEIKLHVVTEEKIRETENFIFQSIEEMKDVGAGKPFDPQQIEDYEVAGSWMTCVYCNFRKLCMRLSK